MSLAGRREGLASSGCWVSNLLPPLTCCRSLLRVGTSQIFPGLCSHCKQIPPPCPLPSSWFCLRINGFPDGDGEANSAGRRIDLVAQGCSVPPSHSPAFLCLFSVCLKENREGRENQLSFFQKASSSYPVSESDQGGGGGLLRSGLSMLSK